MNDYFEKCNCGCHGEWGFGNHVHIAPCCYRCSLCSLDIVSWAYHDHIKRCENDKIENTKDMLMKWDGLIYAHETIPKKTKTIFLAGPTPREELVESWRPNAAYHLLIQNKFDGKILIPEPRDGNWLENYDAQIEWEAEALRKATVLLFWIPRDISLTETGKMKMPAFTTNDEFGVYKATGKIVLGIPENTPHTRYQIYYANKLKIPFATTLSETCDNAVSLAKKNYWG